MRGKGMSDSRCSAHGVSDQKKASGSAAPLSWRLQSVCCQAVLPAAACWGPLIHWMNKARIKDQETSHVLSLSTPLLSINPHRLFSNKNADIHTHNHLSFSLCFIFKMTDEGKKSLPRCSLITYQISHKNKLSVYISGFTFSLIGGLSCCETH